LAASPRSIRRAGFYRGAQRAIRLACNERHRSPDGPTMTQPAPSSLALERLYHWERTTPDRVAFTQPMGNGLLKEFSWKDIADEARRMAAFLQQQGFEPGARIAILSKNCAWWLMSDYAIWMAGYVSVPLYPTLAAGTIAQILEHSGASLLFVGKLDGWEAMRPGVPAGLPCISYALSPADVRARADLQWDSIVARTAPLAGRTVRRADELATIMYTSGTTGMPKGVMHSFGNFAWAIDAGLKRVSIDQEARMLSYLPLAHVAERALVEHGQLATGMHLYFAESLETFARDLQRARPTTFFSVPRLWVKFQQGIHAKMAPQRLERLLKIPLAGRLIRRKILKAMGLDACRYAAGGAAPMPPDLLRWYTSLGLNIIEVYGMTENCGVSHATLHDMRRPGTVGLPYDGVESRLDPQTGEIQVRSGALMMGYYREPELTAAAFTADGWLKTGDKGQLDADGCLRITGRVKDLFKTSKGKYVAPAPIEDRLVTNPAVEACCVAGANFPQPFAMLMLNAEAAAKSREAAGRAALEDALVNHMLTINHALDPHEQLETLVVMTEPWTIENGLITPTFKVKRNELEARFGAQFDAWTSKGRKIVWVS
jgi:long-chain acyl-CoA synthetase